MDLRKLKKLIDLVEESGISELELTEGEEKVRISRALMPSSQPMHYMPVQQMAGVARTGSHVGTAAGHARVRLFPPARPADDRAQPQTRRALLRHGRDRQLSGTVEAHQYQGRRRLDGILPADREHQRLDPPADPGRLCATTGSEALVRFLRRYGFLRRTR